MSITQSTKVNKSNHLAPPVDPRRDHILGNPRAEMTLVEYGSYASLSSQEAHRIVTNLRNRFGDDLCFSFRHKPLPNNEIAHKAAVLAEHAASANRNFWDVHKALMEKGNLLDNESLDNIAIQFHLPPVDKMNSPTFLPSLQSVQAHAQSARKNGALFVPSFFINNKLHEGTWDEKSLSDALTGTLVHKLQTATSEFVRWGPSAGLMLLTMSIIAIILVNSPLGQPFEDFWTIPFSLTINDREFSLPLLSWINDGLLSFFFLAVGLEIKREFTLGRLSNRRAATLPIAAALGGVIVPALLYALIAPVGPLSRGWSTTISTDTAFAIAILVMLGDRIPARLRIFLTATAITDDLISIVVATLFYSTGLNALPLMACIAILAVLLACNIHHVYHPFPYLSLGVLLWIGLREGGIHPTLTGVFVAFCIPTKPQMNFQTLSIQAQTFFKTAALFASNKLMNKRPSENAIRILDNIHDKIESPADRILRSLAPWSSYVVLPLFALANAGVPLHLEINAENRSLMLAIFVGLVAGKPMGILLGAWLADRSNYADKPSSYSWRQLAGAATLSGMGFTMSLFFAGHAFPLPHDFASAKIAIFLASLTAGVAGSLLLLKRRNPSHP